MTPEWLNAIIHDLGQHLGIRDLKFNDRDALALTFENQSVLRMEYASERLTIAVQFPFEPTVPNMITLLLAVHPEQQRQQPVHAGTTQEGTQALFTLSLEQEDITIPNVMQSMETLWNMTRAISSKITA